MTLFPYTTLFRSKQIQFPKRRVLYYPKSRTMEKVKNPSNPVCHQPSSKPFRIYYKGIRHVQELFTYYLDVLNCVNKYFAIRCRLGTVRDAHQRAFRPYLALHQSLVLLIARM
jgi:hypothetical protein